MLGSSEVTHTFSKTFAEAVVDGGNLVLSSGARVPDDTSDGSRSMEGILALTGASSRFSSSSFVLSHCPNCSAAVHF